eukprot:14573934-Heterocapsa_arctica.AAC.1
MLPPQAGRAQGDMQQEMENGRSHMQRLGAEGLDAHSQMWAQGLDTGLVVNQSIERENEGLNFSLVRSTTLFEEHRSCKDGDG